MTPENFVSANQAAEFLTLKPRRILEMARTGKLPAHPLGVGKRKTWRFLLSELSNFLIASSNRALQTLPTRATLPDGSPRGVKKATS